MVEGITDYWILKAISECLDAKGRESLRRDAIIVPSGGVKNLMPLAAMLLGHEVEIRILLDGDEPGLQKGKELKSKLLLESFFVNTYTKNNGVEIEDLFPEQYYLKAVNGAYPKISFKFNKEESQIPSITKRVETAFARISSVQFEKWRPIKILVDNIQNKPEEVPNDTLDAFELFFKDVNESWGKIEKDF